MSWDKNIRSHPERFGLEEFGEVDYSTGSYEFDLTVVWRRPEDGALFYADDSGCSCPTPFEDHDLSTITGPLGAHAVAQHLQERQDEATGSDYRPGDADAVAHLIERLMAQRGTALPDPNVIEGVVLTEADTRSPRGPGGQRW